MHAPYQKALLREHILSALFIFLFLWHIGWHTVNTYTPKIFGEADSVNKLVRNMFYDGQET